VYGTTVQALFRRLFGRDPDAIASAPGRVNLIGEHTDYNGGAVLPAAIPQRTTVAVARRRDRRIVVRTTLDDAAASFALGAEASRHDWVDYEQGCTRVLGAEGVELSGADVAIASTVPAGSGLSSSAALEVALLRALRALVGFPLDDMALARLAHRAEREFVGVPVGIMDQMAVSLADETAALWLDTHTLDRARVPLPRRAEIAVVDSGIRHALASGTYAARRAECARAAAALGVDRLCALGPDALPRLAALPEPLDRRARHVVTEHARVAEAVSALHADDVERLGRLFVASHASQRDDYAVSVPEVDALVELACAEPAVHGARLTGGGFGGAIVLLVARGGAADVTARVAARYRAATGRTATVVVPVTT
jgi:galactokinase